MAVRCAADRCLPFHAPGCPICTALLCARISAERFLPFARGADLRASRGRWAVATTVASFCYVGQRVTIECGRAPLCFYRKSRFLFWQAVAREQIAQHAGEDTARARRLSDRFVLEVEGRGLVQEI